MIVLRGHNTMLSSPLAGEGLGVRGLNAGVDEVGRGPLAGPVVAAAVILPAQHTIVGLNDSKKLSLKKRELLYNQIQNQAIAYCIAQASVEEIDQINILQASLLAMKRAIEGLSIQPDHALIDGNKTPVGLTMSAEVIVKGDSKVESIMAASILAKVWRDRYMIELDQQYPGYGLAQHAGYPTKQHIAALNELGITPIHRVTFGPVARCRNHTCMI